MKKQTMVLLFFIIISMKKKTGQNIEKYDMTKNKTNMIFHEISG